MSKTQSPKLNAQYILEHQMEVHNYDSFGRALSHYVLEQILEEIALQGEQDEVNVNVSFNVKANSKGCITIKTPFGTIHVPFKL